MKQKPLLLLALSLVLLQSCLGTPQVTENAPNPNGQTATPPTEALPSPTPQPTPLPSHLAQLRVAYILEGNVWYWDASTGARQLTSEGVNRGVKLSSDGEFIAYRFGATLLVIDKFGTNPRTINKVDTSFISPLIMQAEFQSGSQILFFSQTNSLDSFNRNLYSVDVKSPTAEYKLHATNFSFFSFSPNGKNIALSSPTDIKIVSLDGALEKTVISYPAVNFYRSTDYVPDIVWMKDSSGYYTVIASETKSRLRYISVNGAIQAQLAEFISAQLDVSQPLISPDGTKVAYVVKNNSTYELHVIDAATIDTVIASYENPPMFELYGWSPDSKRVVFFISDRLFPFAAGIGLPPVPLTESAAPYSLRWLDAERFLFFREGCLLVGQVGSSATFEIASGFDKFMDNINFYDFVLLPSP